MSNAFKLLNASETLNKSVPMLIEEFVSFYGEENREFITDRFNNTLLITYQDEAALLRILSQLKDDKSREIIKDKFSKIGIEYNEENLKLYISSIDNFSSRYGSYSCPIIGTYDYITNVKNNKDSSKYLEDKTVEFLNKIDSSITKQNILEMIEKGKLDKIYEISKMFKEGSLECCDYRDKELKQYYDLYEELEQRHRKINDKYLMKFVNDFIFLAQPEEQEKIKKEIEEGKLCTYDKKSFKNIYGIGLQFSSPFSYFSKDSNLDLQDPKTNDYRKETIMNNRISYFKYKGIDLGDNYLEYVNNEECKKIWPSEELVDDFISKSKYYYNLANIEYYTSLDSYKKAKEVIKSSNLLCSEEHLQPYNFVKRLRSVDGDIKIKDNQYEMSPVVLIYTSVDEYLDENIIHELNHAIELSLLNVSENEYECVCGWDYVSYKLNEKVELIDVNKKYEKRKYELFNEIINESIAQQISIKMHEKGNYIFGSKGKVRDRGSSSYEQSFFLVKPFLEKYFKEIIESRRNNNIDIIFNKVGKENFDMLNELFYEFRENINDMQFYSLMADLKNKVDSENVKFLKRLCEKRDIILGKMEEYSMNKTIM